MLAEIVKTFMFPSNKTTPYPYIGQSRSSSERDLFEIQPKRELLLFQTEIQPKESVKIYAKINFLFG